VNEPKQKGGRGVFVFLVGTFAIGVLTFFGMAVYRIATRPHRTGPVNPVADYYRNLPGDAGVTGTHSPAGKSVGNSNSP